MMKQQNTSATNMAAAALDQQRSRTQGRDWNPEAQRNADSDPSERERTAGNQPSPSSNNVEAEELNIKPLIHQLQQPTLSTSAPGLHQLKNHHRHVTSPLAPPTQHLVRNHQPPSHHEMMTSPSSWPLEPGFPGVENGLQRGGHLGGDLYSVQPFSQASIAPYMTQQPLPPPSYWYSPSVQGQNISSILT